MEGGAELDSDAHLAFRLDMIVLLFVLGAINFADKAVLGLAAVPIIKELHLSPAQYGLVSGSLFWLFAISSVLVTAWADVVGTKKILALLATTWALVQFTTLPGFLAPFVTGLLVQAAGNDAIQGLHNAYLLAALLLLVCGVIFTTFVRPDEAIRALKTLGSDGAAGGRHCHAERSEASQGPS
jgi:MFS family permease